ncbi:hypothetical protein BDZ94DRAFT_1155707 [Collybia nuda]|uniref:Protein CPL1-like domain-containing protein n=1 Tax=Collybia nuda TaxID=64659 RepID=A0A9P6CIH8_9AGAR|nr:hypothetical protein BDZ94DRAFT_1155707 [Collybia nuda]
MTQNWHSPDACICISNLPLFVSTNVVAITGSALVGRAKVIAILTDMIKSCDKQETCYYPPHSVPVCKYGSPCGFTCKDGYTPYPSGPHPTQCVCNKPYTECNGKCGFYYACPSGHVKRDTHKGCQQGLTACGVLGRNAKSWECVNTQDDLESCGGCIIPLHLGQEEGVDCTAIPGISDVSCVRGRCDVHRCMPGYEISSTGDSCVYIEDTDPVFLAAQYGLEHSPLV